MLTYRRTSNLEVVGYSDSDYAECKDTESPHLTICSFQLMELSHGRVVSSLSLLLPLWRLNL